MDYKLFTFVNEEVSYVICCSYSWRGMWNSWRILPLKRIFLWMPLDAINWIFVRCNKHKARKQDLCLKNYVFSLTAKKPQRISYKNTSLINTFTKA